MSLLSPAGFDDRGCRRRIRSLIVYSTAVYLGFRPEEITIYGPSDDPVQTYQQFAYNLGQTVLRSESESHFLPGRLADVRRARGVVAPEPRAALALGAPPVQPRRPGHPRRGDRRRSASSAGRATATRPGSAGCSARASNGDAPHFVLYDEDANFVGRAKHVMLARRPRPAVVPAGAREGAPGSRARRPDRPGVRAEAVRRRAGATSSSARDRLGQRVGERARRRARSASRCCATRRPTSRT